MDLRTGIKPSRFLAALEAAIDLHELRGVGRQRACGRVGRDRTRTVALLATDVTERAQELAAPAAMRVARDERLERDARVAEPVRAREQLGARQLGLGAELRRWIRGEQLVDELDASGDLAAC